MERSSVARGLIAVINRIKARDCDDCQRKKARTLFCMKYRLNLVRSDARKGIIRHTTSVVPERQPPTKGSSGKGRSYKYKEKKSRDYVQTFSERLSSRWYVCANGTTRKRDKKLW